MSKTLTQEEVERRIKTTFQQKVELISEYKNKRTILTLHCLECGHIWNCPAASVLYTRNVSVGHICPNCGTQKQGKIVTCEYCGKEIYRSKRDIENSKSGFFYCSRECGNRHKNDLRRANGEWNNSKDYRSKALVTYEHKCFVCGWDEDERILEAHHIDEDRTNNSIQNLCLLCPTCHRKITLGYYILDKENGKLIPK